MNKKYKNRKSTIIAAIALFFFIVFIFAAGAFYDSFFPVKYDEEITRFSNEYNLEKELVFAVIKAESGFDNRKISEKGATGLMQIMPRTADYIGKEFFNGRHFDLGSANDNVETGCFYLNYLFARFDNLTEVLASYNAGEGNVKLWKNQKKGCLDEDDIPFPETRNYVKKVKLYAKIYDFKLRRRFTFRENRLKNTLLQRPRKIHEKYTADTSSADNSSLRQNFRINEEHFE